MSDTPARRALKLRDLMSTWEAQRDVRPLASSALTPIAEAHERNTRRVYMLTVFPAAVVNAATSIERIRNSVWENNRTAIASKRLSAEDHKSQVETRIEEDYVKRALVLSGGGAKAKDLLNVEINFGFDILNDMLSTMMADGGDAWLSAQITGSWTAFEALAGELWEAALNIHPQGLADLSGKKRKGEQDKSVDLWLLQKHGYDLSASMGAVLKNKYSFDSLEGIREGYSDAFSEDGDQIKALLSERALDALSLVRNLIVHNGAIIDEQYLRRRSVLPELAIGNLGQPLHLDGELVAGLITRPLQISVDLIEAVDDWISEHS